jgi:hypothetical protein
MRALVIVSACTAVLLVHTAAFASPTFPDEIQKHLALTYSPACSLCHSGGVTGFGTVNTPFGKAMRARGLTSGSTASLDTALDQMATENVDSNGDGVSDIQELKNGTDPNANAPGAAPPPEFGCHAGSGRSDASGWVWVTGALASAAFLLRESRRRRRK